jgi:hypothetical protein
MVDFTGGNSLLGGINLFQERGWLGEGKEESIKEGVQGGVDEDKEITGLVNEVIALALSRAMMVHANVPKQTHTSTDSQADTQHDLTHAHVPAPSSLLAMAIDVVKERSVEGIADGDVRGVIDREEGDMEGESEEGTKRETEEEEGAGNADVLSQGGDQMTAERMGDDGMKESILMGRGDEEGVDEGVAFPSLPATTPPSVTSSFGSFLSFSWGGGAKKNKATHTHTHTHTRKFIQTMPLLLYRKVQRWRREEVKGARKTRRAMKAWRHQPLSRVW